MQANARQLRLLGRLGEELAHPLRVVRLPILKDEHIASVLPGRAPGQALFLLGRAQTSKGGCGSLIQSDEPPASPGLRLGDLAFVPGHHPGPADGDASSREVDVVPFESKHLPPAHAGRGQQQPERIEPAFPLGP